MAKTPPNTKKVVKRAAVANPEVNRDPRTAPLVINITRATIISIISHDPFLE
jgi:hypothetical protein